MRNLWPTLLAHADDGHPREPALDGVVEISVRLDAVYGDDGVRRDCVVVGERQRLNSLCSMHCDVIWRHRFCLSDLFDDFQSWQFGVIAGFDDRPFGKDSALAAIACSLVSILVASIRSLINVALGRDNTTTCTGSLNPAKSSAVASIIVTTPKSRTKKYPNGRCCSGKPQSRSSIP